MTGGLKHFATIVACGVVQEIEAPRPPGRYLRVLRRRQRRHSRKLKGSRNRHKSAKRLARLHLRTRNIRQDFLHKLSARLATTKRVIVAEELNVSGMLRKRHLARQIADCGWGAFRRMPDYKCVWYGSQLVAVNRFFPSSKTCSACGHLLEKLPLNVREWDCPGCGTHHDRDENAARNLPGCTGCRPPIPPGWCAGLPRCACSRCPGPAAQRCCGQDRGCRACGCCTTDFSCAPPEARSGVVFYGAARFSGLRALWRLFCRWPALKRRLQHSAGFRSLGVW